MNVTYEKKNAMTFIGYHTEIRPNEGYVKCPEFWEKEYNQKYGILGKGIQPKVRATLADDETRNAGRGSALGK